MRYAPNQNDRIETLLTALASAQGLTQWITGFVLGRNEGGQIVALYGSGGDFPSCRVYEESFGRLPDFVTDLFATDDRPLPKDRETAVKQGRLVDCRRFQIVRYQYPGKEKWFLGGVLIYGREEEPQPTDPSDIRNLKTGDRVKVQGNTKVIEAKFVRRDGAKIVINNKGMEYPVSPSRVSRILYTT